MFNHVKQAVPMTAAEEKELLLKIGKERARERIILSNVPFVLQKARKMSEQYGETMEDLFQEGMIGLHDSYEKFDPSRGVRFLTYGVSRCDRYMRNFIMSNQSPMYEPNNYHQDLQYVNKYGMPENGDIIRESKWTDERRRLVQNRIMFSVAAHSEEESIKEEVTDCGMIIYENSLELSHEENKNLRTILKYSEKYHEVVEEIDQSNPRHIQIFMDYVEGFKRYEVLSREHGVTKQRIGQIVSLVARKIEKRLKISVDAVTFGRLLFEYQMTRG